MAKDKSYPSLSSEFRATHTPVTSLDDPRVAELMAREYPLETDTGYDDGTYQQALSMAGNDPDKAHKIYQELRRTIDIMHVIDHKSTNVDQATELINALIDFEKTRIEALLNPGSPILPQEE